MAGDLEDAITVGALFPQRLKVVLNAGEGVGQRVQLFAVGNPLAVNQLAFDVALHAMQVFGRQVQVKDAQRAADLVQQTRDFHQFGVVPIGFHERHKRLPRVTEIADRLAHDHFQDLARLALQHVLPGTFVGQPETGDLVIQRGFHVQQRTGDIQQRRLVGGAVADDDLVHCVALFHHDAARDAQAHHPQRIADSAERVHLGKQVLDTGLAGAQVQVEGILHPQQILFDRCGDSVEQGAVASAQAAPRVVKFGLCGNLGVQLEGLAQTVERRMHVVTVGDVVQQLPGRLGIGLAARRAVTVVAHQLARLALDAAKCQTQGRGRRQSAVAQRTGDRGCHPQHPPQWLDRYLGQQAVHHVGQLARVGGRAAFGPQRHCLTQAGQIHADRMHTRANAGGLLRRRCRQITGQRAVEIGREQHALIQSGLTTRGTQLVEQRQQHYRDVPMPTLQPLQIIGQLHNAAHQDRACLFVVAYLTVQQAQGEPLHLLGHHCRRVQFDHPQRAVHLVQMSGAHAHGLAVAGGFGVALDFLARLPQGLVQLGLYPAKGGGIDRISHHRHGATLLCALECRNACGRRPGVRLFIRGSNSGLRRGA